MMKPKESAQTAHNKIKRWLKAGKPITPLMSWRLFSCYRLSSVIHRLRNEGLNITTTIHFVGKEYSFASYKLKRK